MEMLTGLSNSPQAAHYCFNLLKSTANGPVSWDHFFASVKQYYMDLRQDSGHTGLFGFVVLYVLLAGVQLYGITVKTRGNTFIHFSKHGFQGRNNFCCLTGHNHVLPNLYFKGSFFCHLGFVFNCHAVIMMYFLIDAHSALL